MKECMNARKNDSNISIASLPSLPIELWNHHIFSSMTLKDIGFFSLVTKPTKKSAIPCYHPFLIRFFKLIELGLQESVERILSKANEEQLVILLYSSLPFVDRLGNSNVITAWQLALQNYDHIVYHIIEKYFAVLPNGLIEKRKQFQQIVSNAVTGQINLNNEAMVDVIDRLITVIASDDTIKITKYEIMSVATAQTLKEFRKFVKQHKHEIMTIYLMALKKYIEQFDLFQLETGRLFEIRVLGYLQSCLATGYLRIKGQGLVRVIDKQGFNDKILSKVNGCMLYGIAQNRNAIELILMDEDYDMSKYKLGINAHIDMLGDFTVSTSKQYHVNFFKTQYKYTMLMHEYAFAYLRQSALDLTEQKQHYDQEEQKQFSCSIS